MKAEVRSVLSDQDIHSMIEESNRLKSTYLFQKPKETVLKKLRL